MNSDNERWQLLVDSAQRHLGLPSEYERKQLVEFCKSASQAKRFIDVGANHGLYSYIANQIIEEGTIILVEANPSLSEQLCADVGHWPQDNRNSIKVMSFGASDRSETLPFFLAELDTVGTLSMKSSQGGATSIDVDCHPVDEMLGPEKQTLMKIDVEGFEYRVLCGARNLLKDDLEIYVELHGWGDKQRDKYPSDVLSLMNSCGYAVERLGRSYTYRFVRASDALRRTSYLQHAPLLFTKATLRRLGLRPAINLLLRRQ